jgi:hypothetical protein
MPTSEDPIDIAVQLAEAASERDPRQAQYGIITADNSMGAYTTYAALWFSTRDEIFEYLTKSFAMLDGGDEDDTKLREIASLAQGVFKKGLNDTLLVALNRHAPASGTRMIWWGTFKVLCLAKDEVPRSMVARFRKVSHKAARGIGHSEIDAFIEFLSELKNR